jgi:hypothetical protein
MIAGLVGSASLLDLVRRAIETSAAKQELKYDTFFIPWMLKQADEDLGSLRRV